MEELLPLSLLKNSKRVAEEIILCNEKLKEYNLSLSPADVSSLINARNGALAATGRLEPGGGVVHKIILSFCESPFVFPENFTETVSELIDIFYFYKNETLDLLSDDELIFKMNQFFNGVCQGSLELLKGRELALFADRVIHGQQIEEAEGEE